MLGGEARAGGGARGRSQSSRENCSRFPSNLAGQDDRTHLVLSSVCDRPSAAPQALWGPPTLAEGRLPAPVSGAHAAVCPSAWPRTHCRSIRTSQGCTLGINRPMRTAAAWSSLQPVGDGVRRKGSGGPGVLALVFLADRQWGTRAQKMAWPDRTPTVWHHRP